MHIGELIAKRDKTIERLYKHLKDRAGVKCSEEEKKHSFVLEEPQSTIKGRQEAKRICSGIVTLSPFVKLLKITDSLDDPKLIEPRLPVLSETVGLSIEYDFEFLMTLYHTYF